MKKLVSAGTVLIVSKASFPKSQSVRDKWPDHSNGGGSLEVWSCASGGYIAGCWFFLKNGDFFAYPWTGVLSLDEANALLDDIYFTPWKGLTTPASGEYWNYRSRPNVYAKLNPVDWGLFLASH